MRTHLLQGGNIASYPTSRGWSACGRLGVDRTMILADVDCLKCLDTALYATLKKNSDDALKELQKKYPEYPTIHFGEDERFVIKVGDLKIRSDAFPNNSVPVGVEHALDHLKDRCSEDHRKQLEEEK